MDKLPIIAVVTQPTRLSGLKSRWATAKAAEFRLKRAAQQEVEYFRAHRQQTTEATSEFDLSRAQFVAGELADESEFHDEDHQYTQAVEKLLQELDLGYPVKTVERRFVPNFDFQRCVMAVAIGQDGLVANCAKYVGDLPIIGVNPDPSRNDGVLLPFSVSQARQVVNQVLKDQAKIEPVTLAEVNTNDGQRMLAFNDFFIGAKSHVSARYTVFDGSKVETQSSSGVLVSTGAGSTGWLSSVFNMARGLQASLGQGQITPVSLPRNARQLFWTVREPFVSKHSSASLVCGLLTDAQQLTIGSQMPTGGVIFSDGVESDFIQFDAGMIARFFPSQQCANLVVD